MVPQEEVGVSKKQAVPLQRWVFPNQKMSGPFGGDLGVVERHYKDMLGVRVWSFRKSRALF